MDVLEVARVRRELSRHGRRFGTSAFTAAETAACERATDPAFRYAEYFAAKEAAWKAVGMAPPDIGGWTQAEVTTGANGAPALTLHGGLEEAARRRGASNLSVTFSHTRDHAIACVVAATSGA